MDVEGHTGYTRRERNQVPGEFRHLLYILNRALSFSCINTHISLEHSFQRNTRVYMIHHYHDTTRADGLLWVLGSLWVWKQMYGDLHLLFFVCSFVSGFVLKFFDSPQGAETQTGS